MTMLNVSKGGVVCVPGLVSEIRALDYIIRIETDLKGGWQELPVPWANLRDPVSTDDAYEATRLLVQWINEFRDSEAGRRHHLDRLSDIAARVQAEVRELGLITGTGKCGLDQEVLR